MVAIASFWITTAASRAVSEEAEFIRREADRSWRAFQRLATLGHARLFIDLDRLAEEHSEPGWDGSDADPVHPDSLEAAARFARVLPAGSHGPSIGVEPDGHVTLEWHSTPRRALSISVSPDGDLHYAAVIGAEQQYGTVPFLDEIPSTIRDLIRRVASR